MKNLSSFNILFIVNSQFFLKEVRTVLKTCLSFLQPMEVYVDDEAKLTLHGLQQHYVKLKENEKNKKLFELLDVLEFNQVCVFVDFVCDFFVLTGFSFLLYRW